MEAVLVIIALTAIGAAGYFAYEARQGQADSVTPKSNKSQETKPAQNEDTQILEAAKKYYSGQGHASTSEFAIEKKATQAAFVRAGAKSDYYMVAVIKENSAWSGVAASQEGYSKDFCNQYNQVPADWCTGGYDQSALPEGL